MHFTTLTALLLPILASALVVPTPTTGRDNANGGALASRALILPDAAAVESNSQEQTPNKRETSMTRPPVEVRQPDTDTCGGEDPLSCEYGGYYDTTPTESTPCGEETVSECYFEGGYNPPVPHGD